MWRTYKVFKQNRHYELEGKAVDYWELTPEEQDIVEFVDDDTVLVEEFEEQNDRKAYKYFMYIYGGDEEHPIYYILESADGGGLGRGNIQQVFSDLNYSGF